MKTDFQKKIEEILKLPDGIPIYTPKFTTNNRVHPVMCIETGEIFPSLAEAAREKNLKCSNYIYYCCTNPNRTTAGFHWRYLSEMECLEFFPPKPPKEKRTHRNRKSRKVICIETGEIFNNCREAIEKTGLKSINSIRLCCKNPEAKAAGFHWKYLDE